MRCLKCGKEYEHENAVYCPHCGFKLKEVTVENVYLPTPHGGVRSEISYFDDSGSPCTKLNAVKMEIHEFDKNGKEVYSFTAAKKGSHKVRGVEP